VRQGLLRVHLHPEPLAPLLAAVLATKSALSQSLEAYQETYSKQEHLQSSHLKFQIVDAQLLRQLNSELALCLICVP
jgi:hypothetical protein